MQAVRRVGGHPDWLDIATLVVASAAFLILFSGVASLQPTPDAYEYRTFAEAIRSGDLLVQRPPAEVPRALATRTPGYPALLAIADLVFPGRRADRPLHVVVGLVALVSVCWALRKECPAWITAAAVIAVQWRMRRYFASPLTEWTCFNGLLVLFAGSVRYANAPSYRGLALLGLLCALLVLTRPAMIVVASLPPAFAILQTTLPRARAIATAFAPFVLVLLWMTFNLHRLGSFTLTPFTGMNLVGVATLVGHAKVQPGDSPELEVLIRELNRRKRPAPRMPLHLETASERRLMTMYNRNVHEVAEPLALSNGWDRVTFDRLLLAYSERALRSHPGAYLEYVLHGIGRLREILPWLIPGMLLPIVWLVRGEHLGLAVGVLAMLTLHVLHVTLCALVEVVISRYVDLTANPFYAASFVAAGAFVTGLVTSRRTS